jgi:hypothetical protein
VGTTSARKHAKLRRLGPGGRGAAPPPLPPAKPNVSPSSETGERNGCGSWNVATTRDGSAAFARTMRYASREVGQPVSLREALRARVSVCSAAGTSAKMEGEGGEEGENYKRHRSASVQHRADPARAGSVSGNEVGPTGLN